MEQGNYIGYSTPIIGYSILLLGTVEWTRCELNYLGSGRHKRFNQSFELQHSNSKFEYQRNASERLPYIGFRLREIQIKDGESLLEIESVK